MLDEGFSLELLVSLLQIYLTRKTVFRTAGNSLSYFPLRDPRGRGGANSRQGLIPVSTQKSGVTGSPLSGKGRVSQPFPAMCQHP